MARVIEVVGPPALREPAPDPFLAILRSIAFQQLAGRAAAAIFGRFLANFEDGRPDVETVLALPEEKMRAAGLSAGKTASMRTFASLVAEGVIPLNDVDELTDDEIVTRLTMVRGIGRWTAEMFLIFQLRRPDVWPVDDFAVRKGYGIAHRMEESPKPRDLLLAGEIFRPYRTVAAWYCWRATDTVLPES